MKKIALLLLIITSGCQQQIKDKDLNLINGYWQILKVEDANGNKKEYKINEIYDYFEIKNKVGFHKKVRWQPAAKFLVNNAQENLQIIKKDNDYYLKFGSENGNHVNKLKSLSEDNMTLESLEKVSFYYIKVNVNTPK